MVVAGKYPTLFRPMALLTLLPAAPSTFTTSNPTHSVDGGNNARPFQPQHRRACIFFLNTCSILTTVVASTNDEAATVVATSTSNDDDSRCQHLPQQSQQ